jgi:hypothetical protein
MTDDSTTDPPDDPTLSASAYLDGEATAEEAERVRASAELGAEVERLRLLRAVVADVEPAPVSVRERQLAAALAAWERLPAAERTGAQRDAASGVDPRAAAAAGSITAPPSRARRRSRSNGWILAAAASLVVLLAGGLTLRSLRSDDDGSDATSLATSDTVESADAEGGAAERTLEAPAADAGSDTEASVAAESEVAELEAAEAAEESDVAGGVTDPSLEPGADISDPDTAADQADQAPPPEDSLEDLTSPDQVAEFASDAVGEDGQVATSVPAPADVQEDDDATTETSTAAGPELAAEATVTFPLCGGADHVVAPALYRGTPVVIAIDTDRDRALAYDPENCSVLVTAPLP